MWSSCTFVTWKIHHLRGPSSWEIMGREKVGMTQRTLVLSTAPCPHRTKEDIQLMSSLPIKPGAGCQLIHSCEPSYTSIPPASQRASPHCLAGSSVRKVGCE